jgi:hypothetical protein
VGNLVNAQNNQTTSVSEESLKGTYQIIIKNSEKEIIFTNEILSEIEKRRNEENEVIYQYEENISIKIFSRKFIQSLKFNRDAYPTYVYENTGKKEQPVVIRKQDNVKSK